MKKNNYRIESDSLGQVKVPKQALYGAQTQRAVDNFKISGITFDPAFIQALASLKYACANANVKCKTLPKSKASCISGISKKYLIIHLIILIIFQLLYSKQVLVRVRI